MTKISPGPEELDRLADLYRTQLLDTPPEPELDALVGLGARVFNTAYCLISLVDRDRLWFKAKNGLAVCEADRSVSFCTRTIQSDQPYVIEDASIDPEYRGNPLVEGELQLRSYLGIPLHCSNGSRIGSFCMLDIVPRSWTDADIQLARKMAKLAELLLQKATLSGPVGLVNGTELTARWSRDLSDDKVAMDITLSRLFGFNTETIVVKDWFTRQVFDCDKERVFEERCRASGEFFDYQMGLADGTVLRVREQVRIVCSGNVAEKQGHMSIHVMKKEQNLPRDCGIQGQRELLVWPDHTACFLPKETSAPRFLLFDILHPANIASFLLACKSARNQGRSNTLTLQLKDRANYYNNFSAALSWESGDAATGGGWFRILLNRVVQRPELDLQSLYNSSLSNAFKSLPGFFYHRASGRIHLSSKLHSMLGALSTSPSIDELITHLERFSGINCRDEITFCLDRSVSKTVEFKKLSFGATRWYQMLIEIQPGDSGAQPNLSVFLIDITESRTARLDAEMNYISRDLVLQSVSDGLLELDDAHSIVFANRQARISLFGQPEVFRAGVSVQSVFSGLSAATLQQAMMQVKQQGASEGHDLYVPATGKSVKVRFIRGNQTNYCVLTDVTAFQRCKRQLELWMQALTVVGSPVAMLEAGSSNPYVFNFVYLNQALQGVFDAFPGVTLKTAPELFAEVIFGHSGKRRLTRALMTWSHATITLFFTNRYGVKTSCLVDVRPVTDKLTLQRHVLLVARNIAAV